MDKISPALSNKFANMRVVAALAVVLIHCYREGSVGSVYWWFTRLVGGGRWGSGGLVRFAVPFFFLASGFFLAGHVGGKDWWLKVVVARMRTLLAPYVVWLTIACVPAVAITVATQHTIPDPHWWLASYGMVNERFPILKQFWFLKCLFLLVVLSPLLVRFANLLGIVLLSCAAGIMTFNPFHLSSSWTWLFGNTFSLSGMAFFALGIYLRRTKSESPQLVHLPRTLLWIAIAFTVLSLSAYAVFELNDCSWSRFFRWIAVPISILAVWGLVPSSPWPKWLTASAFPIFLIHFFFVDVIPKRLMGDLGSIGLFVGLFATWIAGVALSMVLAWCLRKMQPKLAGVLFGGR